MNFRIEQQYLGSGVKIEDVAENKEILRFLGENGRGAKDQFLRMISLISFLPKRYSCVDVSLTKIKKNFTKKKLFKK